MDPRTAMLLGAPVSPTILRLALPNVVVMVVRASIGLSQSHISVSQTRTRRARRHGSWYFPCSCCCRWCLPVRWMAASCQLSPAHWDQGDVRDQRQRALVWHAVAITVALGLRSTLAVLLFGPRPLCVDGRARRIARRGCHLLDLRFRWYDSVVDVQFVRRDRSCPPMTCSFRRQSQGPAPSSSFRCRPC